MKNSIMEQEKETFSPGGGTGKVQEEKKTKVGIAFQGGSFLAGVMTAFGEAGLFSPASPYALAAVSGTSAGAIVAAVCWSETLAGRFDRVPAILKEVWLYNANSSIPTQAWGDFWKSFDNAARANPLYDMAVETFRTPWLHRQFREWLLTYISPAEAMANLWRAREQPHMRLALGTADVLKGEIVTFTDESFLTELRHALPSGAAPSRPDSHALAAGGKFMLEALMASGSLDEINGLTKIDVGTHRGTYLDGAWGQNPPIDVMIDFDVDEIWIVEIFPKFRKHLPATHQEREDRKEELWQNSLVEQQIHMISKVNEWIRENKLVNTGYRIIEVRRIPMTLDFTPGARIVNAPGFLLDKMDYGYQEARTFMHKLGAIHS